MNPGTEDSRAREKLAAEYGVMLADRRAMYARLGVVHVPLEELHAGDSGGCIWVGVTCV